ncbi:TPA: aromatic acid exporter family protein [Streptococcus suis]
MKSLTIGPRILKTGTSIALSIYLSSILIPDSGGVLAGIAALNATLPSIRKSYDTLINRMVGTVIGAVIAVAMAIFFQNTPLPEALVIGIACILTITLLNLFKMSDVISLAIVAVIAIMLTSADTYIESAVYRVLDTFIGVLVSFVINWMIFQPKYDVNFITVMESTNAETLRLIRACLWRNADYSITHRDLRWINGQMKKMDNFYTLVKSEMVVNPKKRIGLARKLVIFRHLALTTKQAYHLLDTLHQTGNMYNQLPSNMRQMIRDRIDILLVAHEQINMKLSGKVAPEQVNFMEITPEYREAYLTAFQDKVWEWRHIHGTGHSRSNELIILMSRIYQYEIALKELNRLMRPYKKFHAVGYNDEYDHSVSENLQI